MSTLNSHNGHSASAQLANTAIDWQLWQAQTLDRARRENKPIHLSIGYTNCLWCQRMQQETYSDAAVISLLNERFINVRVDRDQRPDLDKVYQNAFQLLNGQAGGWPLTMVLTPDDQIPFFGATFVANTARNGLPGFADLMQRLADFYRDREADVRQQNASLKEALQAGLSRHGRSGYSLQASVLQQVIDELKQRFDAVHGGFTPASGKTAKFPQIAWLDRLLKHYQHTQQQDPAAADTRAAFIVKYTLEKMAQSALYDGNSFYRYSHARDWQNPELEKSLVENAALLALYSQTWAISQSNQLQQVTAQLATWLLSQQCANTGGFYNAENQQIMRTANNAQAIKALAIAGHQLQRDDWLHAAERGLHFIQSHLYQQQRLQAIYQNGQAEQPAFLDDYVYLIDALLALLDCRWRDEDYQLALQLADNVLERFQDTSKQGGFYYTSSEHETLIQRPKPVFDDALPAIAGVAIEVLVKLGRMKNTIAPMVAAERGLKNAWPSVERNPLGCCGMLLGLQAYYFPTQDSDKQS